MINHTVKRIAGGGGVRAVVFSGIIHIDHGGKRTVLLNQEFDSVCVISGKNSIFKIDRSIIGKAAVRDHGRRKVADVRVVRGKRNLIFCSHAGPGTQEKGSDHAISTVMIIGLVDKMVIWGVSAVESRLKAQQMPKGFWFLTEVMRFCSLES